jgi:ABC-2 type transport system ATP-binding protein
MIRIENLVKSFGAKRAVDGVSFSVERGEVLGFLGPNGAGKSTTMRMITGFMPPSAGRVTIGGHDVAESPLEAKRLIGYLPESAASYADMTVRGFLNFAAELRGLRSTASSSCAFSAAWCASRSIRCRRATGSAPALRKRSFMTPKCW